MNVSDVASIAGKDLAETKLGNLRLFYAPDDGIGAMKDEIEQQKLYTLGPIRDTTRPPFYFPRPGDVVIDGGANIGYFALYLLSLEPAVKVNCFEPALEVYFRLLANIKANNLAPSQIESYRLALHSWSDLRLALRRGEGTLDASLYGRWKAPRPIETWAPQMAPDAEAVTTIDLDGALELCGVDTVDLLKLDIEGAEQGTLEQFCGRWSRFERIAVEYHGRLRPRCGQRIAELLRAKGYYVEHSGDFEDELGIGMIWAWRQ